MIQEDTSWVTRLKVEMQKHGPSIQLDSGSTLYCDGFLQGGMDGCWPEPPKDDYEKAR